MLKCLMKYEWVKLRRDTPAGQAKVLWVPGQSLLPEQHFAKDTPPTVAISNAVSPGMWSGGIVGLKSILGTRSRTQSLRDNG